MDITELQNNSSLAIFKPYNRLLKRMLDVLVSSVFLVCVYRWVYIVVACCIKISMPGKVMFTQKRTGKDGKTFVCYKFRTMRPNKEADTKQAGVDDPRITPLGLFLRNTSIDELPQFWNVFKGDMSLVGPRPHMLAHTDYYGKLIPDYMLRHAVKPGITGWAQSHNLRGETRELEQMEQRVRFDLWYIRNWSFWLDLRILADTLKVMF